MGRIISVASAKGGVGKTTTVLNLGYGLSLFAGRVLLVDADPQAGLANASNVRAKNQQGLVDLVLGQCDVDDVVTPTRSPNLSVTGFGDSGPAGLSSFEQGAASGRLAQMIGVLAQGYDYVLLDAPAGLSGVTRALLEASQGLLIPVQARSLAVKTLPALLRLMQAVRQEANPDLALEGVVITMLDYLSSAEHDISQSIRETLPPGALLRTVIPRNGQFERASMETVPVAVLPEAERSAKAYMDLALELKSRELSRLAAGKEDGGELGLF